MGTYASLVMTLANSIIGVSVLAMPFCYKQCGIVLASLMLIVSSIMSRLACYYLLKSAIFARRRNFEILALHTFGPSGKLTVELSIIGFMLGTCVAFFVVMGDLGPAILGPILNIDNPASIRASVVIAIAVLVVLPLGLLRNVDSLSAVSAITITFYICLVLKVMGEATTNLMTWDWMDKVYYWRPAGLLQCIPIFSMALSCQTQLFEIFDSVPNASLEKMNTIVRSAVNMCTLMYMTMGFFGYVAFCTQPFSGNLMLSFSPTPTSEVIKMGFVLSVAVSFPLVIFPCRASLHSLLFRRGVPPHHELLSPGSHMPEGRFKCITVAIVTVSLTLGLLIPNIELVLGLVGSTIGILICVIIPAALFLSLTTKNNNERLLAQILFLMGILIMILGSYANLYATEEAITNQEKVQEKLVPIKPPELPAVNLPLLPQDTQSKAEIKDEALKKIQNVDQLAAELPKLIENKETPSPVVEEKADVRKEPPIPEAPEVKIVSETPPKIMNQDQNVIPVGDLNKNESPIIDIKQHAENKDEPLIKVNSIRKEGQEVKEQDILKMKEKLEDTEHKEDILKMKEKLEENEQKQQKLIEEQKQILKDIYVKIKNENMEKANTAFVNPGEVTLKEQDVKKGNSSNNGDVIAEQKENPLVNKTDSIQKSPPIHDNQVIKQGKDTYNKVSVQNEMSNDDVKKSMAEGVPLPIAIRHIVRKNDGVKSVNIVDSANEENGKAVKREILGHGGIQEHREKRDIEEVNIYSTVFQNTIKNIEAVKVDIRKLMRDDQKYLLKQEPAPRDVSLKHDLTIIMSENNVVKEEKESSKRVLEGQSKKYIIENKIEQQEKKENNVDINKVPLPYNNGLKDTVNENEQCVDETQTSKIKFEDKLQPLKANLVNEERSKFELGSNKREKQKGVVNDDVHSVRTESIIKTPTHLSDPDLVLTGNNIRSDGIGFNNEAKPMKRELKSLQTHRDNKQENDS